MVKILMIVDVQKGFMNKNTEDVVVKIQKLIDSKKYSQIVATKYKNENSNNEIIHKWYGMKTEDEQKIMVKGKFEVIDKNTYNSCNEKLQKFVKDKNVTHVDIVGVDTEMCILATAIGVYDLGLIPCVLKDYCASTAGIKMHNKAIVILKRIIGINQVI